MLQLRLRTTLFFWLSRAFLLLNDTFVLAERLRSHNVEVWVQEWHRAMHMFQLSYDVNPDARRTVDEVAAFIRYATTVHEISA